MFVSVPVIAIDGPSASGKGTIATRVAAALQYHYLDSGVIYRVVAWAVGRYDVDCRDAAAVATLATGLSVHFEGEAVYVNGEDVTTALRSSQISDVASRIAALAEVRRALLVWQRRFRQAPGLVADGRDMASVVFPDAILKVFVTASVQERAKRRYKQLIEKGEQATIRQIEEAIIKRDQRDQGRSCAPLQQLQDAYVLDTTELAIDQAVVQVLTWYDQHK